VSRPAGGDDSAELVSFAERLADESRQLLGAAAKGAVRVDLKPDSSFVTDVDRAIETRLRELIEDAWPGHGILGEEFGAKDAGADVTWIIDPVDGTAPFIAGIPVYGTLIGVSRLGRPWIGVLDFPATGDRWTGVAGVFARRNDAAVRTRQCGDLAVALATCSNPDFFEPGEYRAFARVNDRVSYTLYGASSFAYAMLATGRTDLAVDSGLRPYDVFAPAAVISGAGGLMTDWTGASLCLDPAPQAGTPASASRGRILAAGDPALHAAALSLLDA